MENQNSDREYDTLDMADASGFRLADDAPAQTRAFFELWRSRRSGGVAQADAFDISALSGEYPLLVRVAQNTRDRSLFWRDVAATKRWPFKMPLVNRPVVDVSPTPTETRVLLAFNEVLASGLPNYSEITSWMTDGETVSMVRLVVPVETPSGRELLALWEVVQPDGL